MPIATSKDGAPYYAPSRLDLFAAHAMQMVLRLDGLNPSMWDGVYMAKVRDKAFAMARLMAEVSPVD